MAIDQEDPFGLAALTDQLVRSVEDGDHVPDHGTGEERARFVEWLSLVDLTPEESLAVARRIPEGTPVSVRIRELVALAMMRTLRRCIEHDRCRRDADLGAACLDEQERQGLSWLPPEWRRGA